MTGDDGGAVVPFCISSRNRLFSTVTKKHKKPHVNGEPAVSVRPSEPLPAAPEAPAPPAPTADEVIAQLTDQYQRLAADFDNFRKRMIKERAEAWGRAQAELAARVLEALDDLGRVAHLDPERTSAKDLAAGVDLVERKMLKQFESAGLVRVGQPGEKFDPASHEAVSTLPAASPEQDHTVAMVFQPGYRFSGVLLRPARVQVSVWQDAEAPDGGPPA